MIIQYLKTKKIIFPIFIFSCINLVFIFTPTLLRADDSACGQTNLSSAEPLDYIFSRAETIKEPSSQCATLIDIAGAYIELKEFDKSEYILTKAIGLAQHIEHQLVKSELISEIIDKYISLNKNGVALDLAQYINFVDSRADMLVRIVSGYLQQDQYEKALELTQKINEPSFRALALYKIIDRLATQKLFEELAKIQKILELQPLSVQRVMRLILREENRKWGEVPISNLFASKSPYRKTKALIALAKDRIDLDAPEAAGHILTEATLFSENIKGEYAKNECLAQIGFGYVQMGEFEKARVIAYSMKIPFLHAELLARTAIGYGEIKEFSKALKVIADIDVQCFREKAIAQIIIMCLEQGEEKQASGIIEKLENAPARSRVYVAIIKNYLQKKNYGEALEMSKKIENSEIKMSALIEIAKELQKNKQFSGQLREAFLESLSLLN